MADPLRVLIIEDNPLDAELIVQVLMCSDFAPVWERVESRGEMLKALRNSDWDVITCDHAMPQFDAPSAIKSIREYDPMVPIIIVSGEIDIDLAIALLKSGASDFVRKSDLRRLPLSIERELKDAEEEQQRQEVIQALLESEEQYRAIMEQTPSVVIVHREGMVEYINEYGIGVLGYRELNECLGRELTDLAARSKAQVLEGSLKDLLDDEQHEELVIQIIDKDGCKRIFACRSAPVVFQNEPAMLNVLVEITAQKQLAASTQEALARLNEAQRISHIGSFEGDPNSGFIICSDEFIRICGLDTNTNTNILTIDHFLKMVHPEDLDYVEDMVQGAVLCNKSVCFEHRIINVQGEIIYVAANFEPVFDGHGEYIKNVGTMQDITARKIAEQALADSEKRYRMLSHLSSDFVYSCIDGGDGGYQIDWITEAFYGISGYTPKDLAANRCWLFTVHPEDKAISECQTREASKGRHSVEEFRMLKAGGDIAYIRNYMVGISDKSAPGGHRLYGAAQDITDKKLAELALKDLNENLERIVASRTTDLQTFVHSVSHDLRAPLRAISGFSKILEEDYGERLDDNGRQMISRIISASKKQNDMMDALLQLSRISFVELQISPCDLGKIASTILCEKKASEPDKKIRFKVAEGMIANADGRLMQIVLDNLIGNAWKYTAMRDEAVIEFAWMDSPSGRVFYIKDNGVGFDEGKSDSMFEAFRRLHRESDFPGHGVGLSVVKNIIEKHGGRIWAESEGGDGACFYFTLEADKTINAGGS